MLRNANEVDTADAIQAWFWHQMVGGLPKGEIPQSQWQRLFTRKWKVVHSDHERSLYLVSFGKFAAETPRRRW